MHLNIIIIKASTIKLIDEKKRTSLKAIKEAGIKHLHFPPLNQQRKSQQRKNYIERLYRGYLSRVSGNKMFPLS